MTRKTIMLLLFSLALASFPSAARPMPSSALACGVAGAKFDVKQTNETIPAQPEPGKALVFFIERDLTSGVMVTPTTRFGIDGKWVGATHGNSYFYAMIEPGVHHLCAYTQFGGLGGEGQAFAHLSVEAGAVYFFEARNTRVGAQRYGDELEDVALIQADEDQGKYLTTQATLTTSRQRR